VKHLVVRSRVAMRHVLLQKQTIPVVKAASQSKAHGELPTGTDRPDLTDVDGSPPNRKLQLKGRAQKPRGGVKELEIGRAHV